jgi:hypothetical protein
MFVIRWGDFSWFAPLSLQFNRQYGAITGSGFGHTCTTKLHQDDFTQTRTQQTLHQALH